MEKNQTVIHTSTHNYNADKDLAAIQKMHETKTVTRQSLIGWYRWYRRHLPPLQPEGSDVDLLLTLATWMELTEKGGQPPFPYDYKTNLDFSKVDLNIADRPGWVWPFGALLAIAGLFTVFFRAELGVAMILAGLLLHWLLYKRRGGATAVALKNPGVHVWCSVH